MTPVNAEMVGLLAEFACGGPPMPGAGERLGDLILAQIARTPDAPAVHAADATLTYRELHDRANALAAELIEAGVGPDRTVLVCADRSASLVVGLVAVTLADGAYLPVEATWPAERLKHVIGEARPVAAICDAGHRATIAAVFPGLVLDPAGTRPPLPPVSPAPHASDSDAAYVIYTSGSTGWPKGVLVPHRGIVNRLRWMQDEYRLDHTDRVLQKTPYTFDVSVWEFFWPLATGAVLVMAVPDGHRDPGYLIDTIRRESITTIHFVPSMLSLFVDEPGAGECTTLRRVIASGEALTSALANRAQTVLGAGLHNLYGPTEASVDVTYWACRRPEPGVGVPIGRPINGVTALVLDEDGRLVPVGAEGELHLAGVCLARGYVGRPDLTAAAFIDDPTAPGRTLYRTGDIVRWAPEGHLEYLGRRDTQVKVRGLRIELAEIESCALSDPTVTNAVAVVRHDLGTTPKLVLYVVAGSGLALDPRAIRSRLAARLPDYMLPTHVIQLPALPLTESGKCDRAKLPPPSAQPPNGGAIRRRPRPAG